MGWDSGSADGERGQAVMQEVESPGLGKQLNQRHRSGEGASTGGQEQNRSGGEERVTED